MNIYEKLQSARVKLQTMNLKKSGKNSYSGFTYYELADFLPQVNKIFEDLKLFSNFSIIDGIANLVVIDAEKPEDKTNFIMPTAELQLKGCTAIQSLGGVNTYCKRYLYLNALEIVEADMLDKKAGEIEENHDTDIIEGLKATDNIKNLNAYFNKYKDSVNDLKVFQKAYTQQAKMLRQKEGIDG